MPRQSPSAVPAGSHLGPTARRDWVWMVGGILAAAAIVVYARTWSAPLLFDDKPAILDNPTIRHWSTALWAPDDTGAGGRPIVNLSLALNYAISREAVWSYHAFNLAVHVLCGLLLFGIVRRSLARRGDPAAALVGFGAALLWMLHPLLTESVTFVIQRTESLMGLFYLLTLYALIRGSEAAPGGQRGWFVLAVAACWLGMATKEVMVSAPLLLLLYDRTFLAGSFRSAWRQRPGLYAGLAGSWVLLGALMLGSQHRGGSVGFGLGVSAWDYALTQCRAIVLYLKLAIWPHPLVVDYGTAVVRNAAEVWPQALILAGLIAGTVFSLWRRPVLGFFGAWFFAILAPSSSVVPLVTQTVAEHRMYLPLAAVMTLAAVGIQAAARRHSGVVFAALAVGFGLLTARRNGDYRSAVAIWSDTVAKVPDNARAHNNLGNAWIEIPGRLDDAIRQFQAAVRLSPDFARAHNNLGKAWARRPGRLPDAIAEFQTAVRLRPDFAEAHNSLGNAWAQMPGRLSDALAEYQEAVRLRPDFAEAHDNLGNIWAQRPGKLPEAVAEYERAVRLQPDLAEAHNNLGNAWAQIPGRQPDAIAEYREAVRLRPDFPEAHNNLGNALADLPGHLRDAVAEYQEAVRLKPDYAEAHFNLANAWAQVPGELPRAMAEYQTTVRLKPDYAPAWYNLGVGHLNAGDRPAAVAAFRQVLRISPDDPLARQALAAALGSGRE